MPLLPSRRPLQLMMSTPMTMAMASSFTSMFSRIAEIFLFTGPACSRRDKQDGHDSARYLLYEKLDKIAPAAASAVRRRTDASPAKIIAWLLPPLPHAGLYATCLDAIKFLASASAAHARPAAAQRLLCCCCRLMMISFTRFRHALYRPSPCAAPPMYEIIPPLHR